MKPRILFLSAAILAAASQQAAFAQCTGCSVVISGPMGGGILVTSGQVYCIEPGGSVSGGAIIMQGGTLCNRGRVYDGLIIKPGGVVNNYGDSIGGGLPNGGVFNNFGSVHVDGGLMTDSGGYLNNAAGGMMIVDGGLTVGDSLGAGRVDNHGCIEVINGGGVEIYPASEFYTETMVRVRGNGGFVNAGTVSGPATSCGGFNVSLGGATNYGTFGVTGNLDLCDSLDPAGATFNAGGTVGSGVTYCQCQNYCALSGIRDVNGGAVVLSLYPNPTGSRLFLEILVPRATTLRVDILDATGRVVKAGDQVPGIGTMSLGLDVSSLSPGLYFVKIRYEGGADSRPFVRN